MSTWKNEDIAAVLDTITDAVQELRHLLLDEPGAQGVVLEPGTRVCRGGIDYYVLAVYESGLNLVRANGAPGVFMTLANEELSLVAAPPVITMSAGSLYRVLCSNGLGYSVWQAPGWWGAVGTSRDFARTYAHSRAVINVICPLERV